MLSADVRDELAAELAEAERSKVPIEAADRRCRRASTWSMPTRSS